MAADVSVSSGLVKSCCEKWKRKYAKAQERGDRFRVYLNNYEEEIKKVQAENSNLKKACEDALAQANVEKEEKDKESAARVSLENKISELKSEICGLKQKENADAEDNSEVNLRAQVSECKKEINSLNKLVEKEKKRAEAEKKKASEAQKATKAEKSKVDQVTKHVNIEREKVGNYGRQVEVLKKEGHKANSDLASERLKLVEANKKLEAEKQKVVKEREHANSEIGKAQEQKKLAEGLSLELVQSRKRIDELQKEITDLRCSRELQGASGCEPGINRNSVASQEILLSKPDQLKLVLEAEEANRRYEIEKRKAIKEKKQAEAELVKAEKQKKLVEVNRSKATEEKSRADHLSKQLDEARVKIEELSSRKIIEASAAELGKDMDAESVKVKHLKKQLKFEKMQKKHAKEMAKFERGRSSILQQQLGCLKLDFDQFSQRLSMLNKAFSHSAEGIDDPEKMNLEHGIKCLKPGCPVRDASDPFRIAMKCTTPSLPLSGGNCTDSISGIDSLLESPVRGSKRVKLQSSAINSSTASFSDRQLLGSQEKGAFSITTSEKLVEENVQPTISNLSAEVMKINCYENVGVVAENSVRSPLRIDEIGRVNEHGRKRKRILYAVESIENLYCEGKKLHLRVEENLSVLHHLLNNQIEKPLGEGRYLFPSLQGKFYVEDERVYENGKESMEENLIMQNHVDSNEESNADEFEIEVTSENYLKLLDLDDAAVEECYRMAMEMPLSPTLPDLEVEGVEESNGKINSNNLELDESGTFDDVLLHKNGSVIDSLDILGKDGNGSGTSNALSSLDILGKDGNGFGTSNARSKSCGIQDSSAEVMSNAPSLRNKEVVLPFGSELAYAGEDILKCYVVFSNLTDNSSISRICSVSRTCVTQCSFATHTDWMVQEILLFLKAEEKLLPKEKVCVFFSVLLHNFYSAALSKFGSLEWKSIPCVDSFAQHICSVMSDGEGRTIFSEFGCLDDSLSLMEDFLINGRVVTCKEASSETLVDGVRIACRPASADELVAGSIVLASICAAFDHIGFISEISYNILQMSESNHSLVLTILHVFAYLGRGSFFKFGNYNLMTVMKSIVTNLEGGSLTDSAGSCIPSSSNSGTEFCPCVKCPFSVDAVSVETATSLLLERLQSDALLGAKYQDVMESGSSNSSFTDLTDLLSLVELVAINMSWEWTSAQVVPRLLKVLHSCMAEKELAGIIVLLGQLGRLGVNEVGYEDKGVEILRSQLSGFLCRDSGTSFGLPTQIATVTALLKLMPYDFETIIQSNVKSVSIGSQTDPAQSIRKWFSLLPKKQRDLSFGLLQAIGLDKS